MITDVSSGMASTHFLFDPHHRGFLIPQACDYLHYRDFMLINSFIIRLGDTKMAILPHLCAKAIFWGYGGCQIPEGPVLTWCKLQVTNTAREWGKFTEKGCSVRVKDTKTDAMHQVIPVRIPFLRVDRHQPCAFSKRRRFQ
jgi:hypothetical protein